MSFISAIPSNTIKLTQIVIGIPRIIYVSDSSTATEKLPLRELIEADISEALEQAVKVTTDIGSGLDKHMYVLLSSSDIGLSTDLHMYASKQTFDPTTGIDTITYLMRALKDKATARDKSYTTRLSNIDLLKLDEYKSMVKSIINVKLPSIINLYRYVKTGDKVLSRDINELIDFIYNSLYASLGLYKALLDLGINVTPKAKTLIENLVATLLRPDMMTRLYKAFGEIVSSDDWNVVITSICRINELIRELDVIRVSEDYAIGSEKSLLPIISQLPYRLSTVSVTVTGDTPVDDTESIININLINDSTVLIIYNASNKPPSQEGSYGKKILINIDDQDIYETRGDQCTNASFRWDNPTSIYVGELPAGPHTIKGRFASVYGNLTVEIDIRQIIVIAIPKSPRRFIEGKMSTVKVTTSSNTLIDDPEAIININLPEYSRVIIFYNASNMHGSTESYVGKYGLINIDGDDKPESRVEQGTIGWFLNRACGFTSIWAGTLSAGSHTIKGRFASNEEGQTVTIDQRQIAVIIIPSEWHLFNTSSTVRVQTTSTTLVDDTEAILNFNLPSKSLVIALYNASNKHGSLSSTPLGMRCLINVDWIDVDATESYQTPTAGDSFSLNITSVWAGILDAGPHIIKGRFASNEEGEAMGIDQRVIIALAIPLEYLKM